MSYDTRGQKKSTPYHRINKNRINKNGIGKIIENLLKSPNLPCMKTKSMHKLKWK